MTQQIVLSASAINDFRACPERWYKAYILGLRSTVDKDSLRVGSVWHRCRALISSKPGGPCVQCPGETCEICGGTGKLPENLLEAVVAYINREYAEVPANKTYDDWIIERSIILSTLLAYEQHYSAEEYEVVANEVRFEMPLYSLTGEQEPLDEVVIHGTIDQLLRDRQGRIIVREYKTTSKSLDDETFWGHLAMDAQTLIYLMATQYLQYTGGLAQYGVENDSQFANSILYNVWHKPGISPKWLTQTESKEFAKTEIYCGKKFQIDNANVNGEQVLEKPGAKEGTVSLFETPQMFSARLFQDIAERPVFYFQQREVGRTTLDLKTFWKNLYHIYKTMRFQLDSDCLWADEKQCNATFRCNYTGLCYNHIEIDPENPPDGFEFIHRKEEDVKQTDC